MAQFIGVGDLHLTTHTGHSYWSRFEDYIGVSADKVILTDLLRILDYAVKEGVRHVFFYGDLGHGARMSYSAHLLLLKVFQRYASKKRRLHFHLILGNHDWMGAVEDGAAREIDPSFLLAGEHSLQLLQHMVPDNVSIYTEPTTVLLEGVLVQFLPYPHPIVLPAKKGEEELTTAFKPYALNVFHKETGGAMMDTGKKIVGEKTPKDVLGVSGHLHTNQRVRNVFYAGSPIQHTFGERPEKFFHHIKINITDKKRRASGKLNVDDDDWEVLDIPFEPTYRLQNVYIETRKDFKQLRDVAANTLIKIHLNSKVVFSPEDYEKYAKGVKIVGFNPYAHKALEDEVAKVGESSVMNGDEVIIDPDEFLRAWFASQNMDDEETEGMMKLRRKMKRKLGGA